MYELKTLLPNFEITLPTTMYTLKSLALDDIHQGQGTNGEGCGSGTLSNSSSPMPKLELRQQRVIDQLNQLKMILSDIRKTLNVCEKPVQRPIVDSVSSTQTIDYPLENIVINAHPNCIPYALLGLKHLWKNNFNLQVSGYLHSSIDKITPEALKFQQRLCGKNTNSLIPTIDIRLIWKDCEHTEMITSPTMYVPIYGEVNIVRYLSRVGPSTCNYENTSLCNQIDSVLDISYQLLNCSTPADLISCLSSRLEKKQFFGGDNISIADIGLFSTLKRTPAISVSNLPTELASWYKRVKTVTSL